MKRVAIHGLSRKGRLTLRTLIEKDDVHLVAVTDPNPVSHLVKLLQYDTVYGLCKKDIKAKGNRILIENKEIMVFNEKEASMLPWKDLNIDIVFDGTVTSDNQNQLKKHINAGAKEAVVSVPSKEKSNAVSFLDKIKWYIFMYMFRLS